MIKYSETFATITPESAEYGDYEETGFIDENLDSDFRDMVDLLECTEVSSSSPQFGDWFTLYDSNDGTPDYYETGVSEQRSYHPKTERDFRYMLKAYNYSK